MNFKYATQLIALLALTFTYSQCARAVVVAEDNAGNAAYADGWTSGDNGGTGFGPWAGLYVPEFLEIDTTPAQSDNNVGAPAFRGRTGGAGLGSQYYASRTFSAPLQVGQTFSMDYDSYALLEATESGRDLSIGFKSGTTERFSIYGYASKWKYGGETVVDTFGSDFLGINAVTALNNQAGGATLPGGVLGAAFQMPYTATDGSDGFSLSLTLVTADTYRLKIVDDSVTKVDVSGQLLGAAGLAIDSFFVYGSETGDYYGDDIEGKSIYFNNLKVESASGTPGDFDADGDVDGRDFLTWQRNTSVGSLADWQANYGFSGLTAISAVPEPASLGLGMCGLFASSLLGFSRRKRSR